LGAHLPAKLPFGQGVSANGRGPERINGPQAELSGKIFAHKASLTRILPSGFDVSALREKEAHIEKASS